jgi:hypothetical protein
MKKFLIRTGLFAIIGLIIGEVIVRQFHLNTDIPKIYMDSDNLIKFKPNQTGYYVNGTHKWMINKYGNYGPAPKSLDSLVTILGDSFISNVMNPPECHQANFLSHLSHKFNFYPSSRDGASFIEYMEMAKSLNRLKPVKQLLYVHHGDFVESVMEIGNEPFTVQLSLKNSKIRYAQINSSKLKEILYNLKFPYFIYRNYVVKAADGSLNNRDGIQKKIDYDKIQLLLNYVKANYKISNIVLVFSPDSDKKVIQLTQKNGFQTVELKSANYKSWQMKEDSHWSCYGHEQAANQVNAFLENNIN